MSVLDTSGLVTFDPIEANPVPAQPETPAVDATAGNGTEDSTGSQSGTLDLGGKQSSTAIEMSTASGVRPYNSAAAKITTALTESAGASPIAVANYEIGTPPTLAAAATLLIQITARSEGDASAKDAAYQLLSADSVLALTGD